MATGGRLNPTVTRTPRVTPPRAAGLTPLNIKVEVNGVLSSQLMIDEMRERGMNVQPVLSSIAVKHALEDSGTRRMEHYPFKPVSLAWRRQKAKEGLSPKTMHASGRLARALEHIGPSDVRVDARRTTLDFGIKPTSDLWMRAHIQASRGRRAVVIDAEASKNIALLIAQYVGYGYLRRVAGTRTTAGAVAQIATPGGPGL